MLAGTSNQRNSSLFENQVRTWWSDVNLSALNSLAVARVHRSQTSATAQYSRKRTGRTVRDMDDDENAGVEVLG